MKKLLSFIFAVLFIVSCNSKTQSNAKLINIEVQDKYIVLSFEESGFSGSEIEFRALGTETDISSNPGKDITVKITSPNQKIAVNPASGYNIQIADLTSGNEKILYETNNITTYLFYEEFDKDEALPENVNQADNTEPWKNKWVAVWKGGSAWNHSMNGSFRNIELKQEGDTEYIHFRGTKTGDDENNPNWREWAAGGEIDIMEYVYQTPQRIDQTIHTGYYGTDGADYDYSPGNQPITNTDDWHIYTFEWTKEGLYWYIDGVKGREPYLKTDDIKRYPFTDKSAFYIIMNVGVGRANNNGNEDNYPGGAQAGLDTWMDVDWVKVYPNKDTILDNSRGDKGCEYYKDVQW